MNEEFPYDEYAAALKGETEVRNTGVEATVIAVEDDPTRPDCVILGVEYLGRFDSGLFEDGSVRKENATVGHVVAFEGEDESLVVVKGRKDCMPLAGDRITIAPPDYLAPLREFAGWLKADPESRHEERFMELRDSLLTEPEESLPEIGESGYLRWAQNLALHESMRRDFSLVWGPPGTGKSYTLGHVAEHYRALGKRVLVLSTTNAAVDVVTFAIDDACSRCGHPLKDGEMIRYAQTLTQPEEYRRRQHLMAYTKLLRALADEQRKAEKALAEARKAAELADPSDPKHLASFLKVEECRQALFDIGQRRRSETAALVSRAKIVCSTLTSCMYNQFISGNFDVVLMDEASQIPLSVWPFLLNKGREKKFIVAGDPMQLDPVQAKSSEIGTRKWLDLNIYAYLGMTTFKGIEPFYKAGAMTLLNEQTRMRKGICGVVSRLFYNGLLEGDRTDAPMSFEGSGLPSGDIAVLDPGAGGEMFGLDRLPGTFARSGTNSVSAGRTVRAIRSLVESNPAGRKLNILVVTPFRNQAYRIYKPRLNGLADGKKDVQVRVSTVHGCQGAEADVVFFDLVDPASNFIARPDASHLWCVACSRAREKLVIVGERDQMRKGFFSSVLLRLTEESGRHAVGGMRRFRETA